MRKAAGETPTPPKARQRSREMPSLIRAEVRAKKCSLSDLNFQQIYEGDVPRLLTEIDTRDRHRQIEPARSRASRIEEQDSIAFRLSRLVGMPADDDLKTCGGGIEVKRVNVVQNVNRGCIRFDDFRFGQRLCPRVGIHISTHRKNRGNRFQLVNNFRIAYVTGVNNQVRAFECAQRLWAEQSMRV